LRTFTPALFTRMSIRRTSRRPLRPRPPRSPAQNVHRERLRPDSSATAAVRVSRSPRRPGRTAPGRTRPSPAQRHRAPQPLRCAGDQRRLPRSGSNNLAPTLRTQTTRYFPMTLSFPRSPPSPRERTPLLDGYTRAATLPAELQVLVGEQDRQPPARGSVRARNTRFATTSARAPPDARRAGAGPGCHQRPASPALLLPPQVDPLRGARSELRGQLVPRFRSIYPSRRETSRDLKVLLRGEIGKDPQIVGHVRHPEAGDLRHGGMPGDLLFPRTGSTPASVGKTP